ncbi:MAG: 4Fe-4S binding protein, partial [Oscillospiraceae bacterium]|nr:4Fe-4S binding protein [Oscillospiraceae bacterium]
MNSLRYWKIDYSAVHDGPGIRTAVFFKACPLRCLWCANPEGQAVGSSLLYYQNRCAKCHRCVEVCPNHAISADDTGAISIDRSLCKLCTQCAAHCRNNALMPIGKSADVDELMREFERNRMFYR